MSGSEHPGPIRVMRIIARLNIGGPARHVAILTAGLDDDSFTSLLVTGVISEAEGDMAYLVREAGIEPVVIPSLQRELSPLSDIRTLWTLVGLMRRFRPHVVHTHTAKAGLLGRLAAALSGVPVILHTFHGHVFHGYFGGLKTRLFIGLERGAARLSDVVLTISDRLRDELVSYRIAPAGRIRVVPLGLHLSELSDLTELRGRLRQELGLSSHERLVGIIGRLAPIKQHELFLAAAQIVRQTCPEARFLIIGDGERRAELEAMTSSMGLADGVIFTGWRMDLPTVYADLDAVVISSRNEGTPVSLIEAMAAGVPVISTRVGGVPDLLNDGVLGLLTPPGDASALAAAVVETLAGRDEERIQNAQDWVLTRYSAERLVADMRELYIRLLSAKGWLPQ